MGRMRWRILAALHRHSQLWEIVFLQEVNLSQAQLEEILRAEAPSRRWVAYYNHRARAGSLIVLGHQWQFTGGGGRGTGHFVWAAIRGPFGSICIGSMNALVDVNGQGQL